MTTPGINITLREKDSDLWSVHFLTENGALVPVASHLRRRDARRLARTGNDLRAVAAQRRSDFAAGNFR